MTPKKLREDAGRWADRVLRNEAGYDEEYTAAAKFIRQELAEHPEDDDEPITEEWIAKIGHQWTRGLQPGGHPIARWTIAERNGLDVIYEKGVVAIWDDDCNEIPLNHIKTRGQLRRLLDVLGIKPETAPAATYKGER